MLRWNVESSEFFSRKLALQKVEILFMLQRNRLRLEKIGFTTFNHAQQQCLEYKLESWPVSRGQYVSRFHHGLKWFIALGETSRASRSKGELPLWKIVFELLRCSLCCCKRMVGCRTIFRVGKSRPKWNIFGKEAVNQEGQNWSSIKRLELVMHYTYVDHDTPPNKQ